MSFAPGVNTWEIFISNCSHCSFLHFLYIVSPKKEKICMIVLQKIIKMEIKHGDFFWCENFLKSVSFDHHAHLNELSEDIFQNFFLFLINFLKSPPIY